MNILKKLMMAGIAIGTMSVVATTVMASESQTVLNAQLQHCEFANQSPIDHQRCFERAMQDYLHAQSSYHHSKATIEKAGGEAKMPAKRKALNDTLKRCEFPADSPFDNTECFQKRSSWLPV